MNPNKAPGPDNQHPCVLYDILDVPLLLIFWKSMEESCLPESWKQAKITPIHKKGSRSLSCNYRPINITRMVCKTKEYIIRKHIMQHMESNGLFSGFFHGRSAITQLLEVLDNWFSFYDEHTCVDTIYLDFSIAFDSVPHARLIAQLYSYGTKQGYMELSYHSTGNPSRRKQTSTTNSQKRVRYNPQEHYEC